MVSLMETTLNIDDAVLQRLREEAARRGTTMSALVEACLRLILVDSTPSRPSGHLPPLPSWNGGKTSVDIANRVALFTAMERD